MIRQFKAKINNENEVANVFHTGLEESKKETIFVMSNGEWIQIAHKDYEEELKEEGFWIAGIFENGHKIDF